MADQVILDKTLVVCPLSLKLGYVQNYRVTERPNRGALESRPVKDTDAFAEDFFKVLRAPRYKDDNETPNMVEVTHATGKTIQVQGIGQPDAQALKFSMKMGLQARQNAVRLVNAGEVRAPKKNWDKTFGPTKSFTSDYQYPPNHPRAGETIVFQLGGGKPLDELKQEFPDLYGTKTRARAKAEDEGMIDDDALDALETDGDEITQIESEDDTIGADEGTEEVAEPMAQSMETNEDELAELADEVEGEEDRMSAEEESESYAAVETASTPQQSKEMDELEDLFEDNTEPGESAAQAAQEGRISGAAAARHELKERTGSGRIEEFDAPRSRSGQPDMRRMTIQSPGSAQAIRVKAIKYMAKGKEHTAFMVECPEDGTCNWWEAGHNNCRVCGAQVQIEVR